MSHFDKMYMCNHYTCLLDYINTNHLRSQLNVNCLACFNFILGVMKENYDMMEYTNSIFEITNPDAVGYNFSGKYILVDEYCLGHCLEIESCEATFIAYNDTGVFEWCVFVTRHPDHDVNATIIPMPQPGSQLEPWHAIFTEAGFPFSSKLIIIGKYL